MPATGAIAPVAFGVKNKVTDKPISSFGPKALMGKCYAINQHANIGPSATGTNYSKSCA